ncbi:MAG: type II toxin-antitoxin system antitoxin SocA domain-containing protein [bacterium]
MGNPIDAKKQLQNLILEILKEEWNHGNKQMLTIKLIKLLYLTECEFFRRRRRRLTNLEWIFYKFGPFAFDLQKTHRSIIHLEEEEKTITSDKTIKLLSIAYGNAFIHEKFVADYAVSAIIKRLVGYWKDKSTRELLNFVYHHTEPMILANRGHVLDFSVIPETLLFKSKISKETVKEFRKRLKYTKAKKTSKSLYPLPELTKEWRVRLIKALEDLEANDIITLPKLTQLYKSKS